MAFSYQNYTGDNATDTFAIPFDYTAQSEISVTVDGVAETGLTFPSAASVQLTSTPASGTLVQVRRTTDLTARSVDFASGSVLTEEDLDNSNIQTFHAAQEAVDKANDGITLGADDKWDAQSNIIKNVGDPVDNTDAVNKQFISTNLPNINTVAGISGDVTTVATNISDVNTVVANIVDIQNAEENAQESKDYAIKVNGEVQEGGLNSGNHSSKAWSIGGVGVTSTAGSGAAKEWAITPSNSTVDGTEMSSKAYAVGDMNRGSSGAHSAKDWASYVSGSNTVDGTFHSAKYYAEQASSTLDSFDDTYLGHKSTEPSLDNDNNPLIDGALFYDTTAKKLKVYNTTDVQWTAIEAGTTSGFAIAMSIAL
jgi:hypothetical protein